MMVLCEPKHVGAAFIILTILIIYEFCNLCALVGKWSVWSKCLLYFRYLSNVFSVYAVFACRQFTTTHAFGVPSNVILFGPRKVLIQFWLTKYFKLTRKTSSYFLTNPETGIIQSLHVIRVCVCTSDITLPYFSITLRLHYYMNPLKSGLDCKIGSHIGQITVQ